MCIMLFNLNTYFVNLSLVVIVLFLVMHPHISISRLFDLLVRSLKNICINCL